MTDNRPKIRRTWTPPERSRRERRNARVRLIGSLLILALLITAVIVALL